MTGDSSSDSASEDTGLFGRMRAKIEEAREERREEAAERQRQEEAAQAAAQAARQAAYDEISKAIPLPAVLEPRPLPGGLTLFNDEFLVEVDKDWGWNTERLILTTQRLIHTRGWASKDQEIVSLIDIRDVRYHKELLRQGELEIETAGGHSMTGLPSVQQGAQVRDHLLRMVYWARERAQRPQPATAAQNPPPAQLDRVDQIRRLKELLDSGALTEEEFQAEKRKVLEQE